MFVLFLDWVFNVKLHKVTYMRPCVNCYYLCSELNTEICQCHVFSSSYLRHSDCECCENRRNVTSPISLSWGSQKPQCLVMNNSVVLYCLLIITQRVFKWYDFDRHGWKESRDLGKYKFSQTQLLFCFLSVTGVISSFWKWVWWRLHLSP